MGAYDIADDERQQLRQVGGIIGAIADEVSRATEQYINTSLLRVPEKFRSKFILRHRGQTRAGNLVEAIACYSAAHPDGPITTLRAHDKGWPEFVALGRYRLSTRWHKPQNLSARATALRAQAPETTMRWDQTTISGLPDADPTVTELEPIDLGGTIYITALCQTTAAGAVRAVDFACPLDSHTKWTETATWDDIVRARVEWPEDSDWLQLARSSSPLRDTSTIPVSDLPAPPEVPSYEPKPLEDDEETGQGGTAAGQ